MLPAIQPIRRHDNKQLGFVELTKRWQKTPENLSER